MLNKSSVKWLILPILIFLIIIGMQMVARESQAQSSELIDPNIVVSLHPIGNITHVAAGHNHTCALTSTGGVKCWGYNGSGQLGDGTKINRSTPVDVSGLNSGIISVATGYAHTCALTSIGSVKCWGQNYSGQLGDGTTISHTLPIEVIGLASGVTAISTGGYYTCAITNAGTIKCWGQNGHGQLGDGTGISSYTPVNVTGLSDVISISASYVHICALTSSGGAKCWGYNYSGELGDGSTVNRNKPVDVIGLTSGVTAIAAGWNHTCALTNSSGAKCWGQNHYSQLGDGTKIERHTPVDVVGLTSDVTKITTGYNHSCVVRGNSGAKCWGSNEYGELGDGSTIDRNIPVNVSGLISGVKAISAGSVHTCAVTSNSGVKCWGDNYSGQLGDATQINRPIPTDVLAGDSESTIFIGGRVTDEGGTGLPNITIQRSGGNSFTTDASGYYTFANLISGTYVVTPMLPGKIFTPASQTVSVPPSKSEVNFITTSIQPPSDHEPIIFIPGIAGSYLVAPNGEELWPAAGYNPVGIGNKAYHMRLTLDPNRPTKEAIIATDAIRQPNVETLPDPDIYKSLLDFLTNNTGYREYLGDDIPALRTEVGCDLTQNTLGSIPTLFVFAWDWRYGAVNAVDEDLRLPKSNVELLADYVKCIQKFHPGRKITIIAHSMGGLLARKYIVDNPGNHGIGKLITIGTPWLGAPKGLNVMLTGDFDWKSIRADVMRQLVEYLPGGHQLLPSAQYFQYACNKTPCDTWPYVVRNPPDPYAQDYKETYVTYGMAFSQTLQSRYKPSVNSLSNYSSSVDFVGNNKLLHAPNLSDWRGDSSGVEYHVIYGEGYFRDTIGQVYEDVDQRCIQLTLCIYTLGIRIRYTYGDTTVPLLSAVRQGNGFDLTDAAHLYRFKQQHFYDPYDPSNTDYVDHGGLTRNLRIQNCIKYILGLSSQSCADDKMTGGRVQSVVAQQPTYIYLWGVSVITVTNGISVTPNLINNSVPTLETILLPYNLMGDDSVALILPPDKPYTITVKSKDYLKIEATLGTEADLQRTARFVNMTIPVSTSLQLIATQQSNIVSVAADLNNDGIYETLEQPSAILESAEAQDSADPTVNIHYNPSINLVTLTGQDDLSGIGNLSYSLDGVTYALYAQPFTVPAILPYVYARAEDKAGNVSSVVVAPIAVSSYRTFLPIVSK